ncbi:MAG: hypothetical protein JNG82_12780 [Opitutaceae bacterium]|nr:hypothetical protein [Opitutaceae bacterium]
MLLLWLNGIIGLIFGIFALTNTIFPYAITIPVLRQLKTDQVLVRKIPKVLIHSSPIIWTLLSAAVVCLYWSFFRSYLPALAVGYAISLCGVIYGISKGTKRQDIARDLVKAYEDYFDMERLREHPLFHSLNAAERTAPSERGQAESPSERGQAE